MNMPPISVTFEVSRLLRSRDVSVEQPLNILPVLVLLTKYPSITPNVVILVLAVVLLPFNNFARLVTLPSS